MLSIITIIYIKIYKLIAEQKKIKKCKNNYVVYQNLSISNIIKVNNLMLSLLFRILWIKLLILKYLCYHI